MNKTFANFLKRMKSCIERYCPDEVGFSITLIKDRDNGQCFHISSLHPLDEAAGLRELAAKLERRAVEEN